MTCVNTTINVVSGADDVTVLGLFQDSKSTPFGGSWWTSITRITATVGVSTLDSQSAPAGSFDWSSGDVRVRLGRASGLTAGYHDLRLRIYMPEAPNGLAVWQGLPRVNVMS